MEVVEVEVEVIEMTMNVMQLLLHLLLEMQTRVEQTLRSTMTNREVKSREKEVKEEEEEEVFEMVEMMKVLEVEEEEVVEVMAHLHLRFLYLVSRQILRPTILSSFVVGRS